MTLAKGKKSVMITLTDDTYKELKIAAVRKGITLSNLLASAGTASISRMKPNADNLSLNEEQA